MKKLKLPIAIVIFLIMVFGIMPVTYGEFFSYTPTSNSPIDEYGDTEVDIDTGNSSDESIIEDSTDESTTDPTEEKTDTNDEEPIKNSNRKVFLTFDDGPTSLTPKVLHVLQEYNVNATFFTIGRLMERYPDIVLRTYEEGNMVLPHSYSHDFSMYSTFDTFYEDFNMAESAYKNVLGFDAPPYFRFPGGSSNHSSFMYGGKQFMPQLTVDIIEKGYYYIDWNVNSGDTTQDYKNGEKLLENIIAGIDNKDFAVILFHDLPRNTEMLRILPDVIEFLEEQNYTFRTFRDITEDELEKMIKLKISNKPIIR